ncbi:MAG: insulinase family protein [Flavobacteriales bacterium]|nr:insulinase family protein [Flavobacteriales bacterium]
MIEKISGLANVKDRKTPPKISDNYHIEFESPKVIKLSKFCNAFWLNNVPNETSRIDLYFDAGSVYTQPVVASITAAMLLTGNEKLSSQNIHEKLDFYGAYFDVEVTHYHCIVHLYALKENLVNVLTTFIEALNNMGCLERELKLILDEKKQKFDINLERVGVLAQRNFQKLVFDGTRLSSLTKTQDFNKISAEKIENFYSSNFLQGLSRIHVISAINESQFSQILSLVKPICALRRKTNINKFENKKIRLHLPRKNALQTAIRIGKICINKHHPDFIGFTILCTILGDYFGSRLMKNIREDKGYTYGIGCMIQELKDTAVFIIATEVGVDQRELAIEEIKKEIGILQSNPVPKKELDLVKNYLLGQALKAADGPYAQFDLFTGVNLFDLELDYYLKYLEKLKNITSKELQQLAINHLNWEDLTVVTVG